MGFEYNNNDDQSDFNTIDHPPILRDRCCPKCGSEEIFVKFQPIPKLCLLQKLIYKLFRVEYDTTEKMLVSCCDCRYETKIDPLDAQTK